MSEYIDCDKCGYYKTCDQTFCQYDWDLKQEGDEE